jgi:hypothetical protein
VDHIAAVANFPSCPRPRKSLFGETKPEKNSAYCVPILFVVVARALTYKNGNDLKDSQVMMLVRLGTVFALNAGFINSLQRKRKDATTLQRQY